MSDVASTKAAWPTRPLGEVFRINGDQVIPMASRLAEFVHYSIPAWDATGGPALELGSQIESNKTSVRDASVLVSKLNPRKPRVVAIPAPAARTCCSTEFICYQPKQAGADLGFWAAYFASAEFSGRLARVAVGSTNSHTRASPKETLRWLVPEVPFDEQRKIARVLDLHKSVIHETEAIIAKLKAVKQGLQHDLLTRGIDANGELRPPQAEAPHLYMQSPLGWIPLEWDVTSLERVSSTVTSGSRDWARFYADSGALFVRIGNLTRKHINLRFDSMSYVRPPHNADGQRTQLEPGDILVSITADLGIVGVVPDGLGEAYINQHIALVRPAKHVVNGRFVGHYLASAVAQTYISKLNDASAKAGLNLPTVRGLPIVRPVRSEQDLIAERLDEIDHRIENATKESAKLRELKVGLMDDLLTGRVRVTPLLDGASPRMEGV